MSQQTSYLKSQVIDQPDSQQAGVTVEFARCEASDSLLDYPIYSAFLFAVFLLTLTAGYSLHLG